MKKIFSGRATPLEDFPDLFAMEAHTGAFGVVFVAGWFIVIAIKYPAIVPSLWPIPVVIGAIFFMLVWASLFPLTGLFSGDLAAKLRNPALIAADEKERLEVRVRLWIMLLSAAYAVGCGLLIWVTGGARSPFVPFYVMTFTLTISRTKVPIWYAIVLGYFLIVITAASWAAAYMPPTVSGGNLKEILASEFQTGTHYVFIALSLIVPTASAYLLELQNSRRQPK